uniref:Uncharacterized protein n=1 Tax=Tanacetum cinerariifolium TaxID=118510 RepID=A0A6L2NIU4_TANCI|nr:hypothetical protein [Tanacetum cinerariifolium]
MERIGYDELTSIFSKVPDVRDRRSFSQVSKHILSLACIRLLKLKISSFPWMPYMKILPVSINLVSLECGKRISNTYMELLAQSCSKLKYLKLSLDSADRFGKLYDFDDNGLCAIANGCPHLCEVDLSGRLGVRDVGVVAIFSDTGVTCLRELGCLTYLNLSKCGVDVTDNGVLAVSHIQDIEKLDLSWLRNVTRDSLFHIANDCRELKEINLSGCNGVTREVLHDFANDSRVEKLGTVFVSRYFF